MTLRQMRENILIVVGLLVLLDAAALGYLLSPWGRSVDEFQEELNRLKTALRLKEAEVAPARGMDKKIARARTDLKTFFAERMPEQASAVPARLGELAAKHRVQMSQVKYKAEETSLQGVRSVAVEASLAGEYLDVARFLNAVERDAMFSIIRSIALDDQEGGGTVRLALKMETYIQKEN